MKHGVWIGRVPEFQKAAWAFMPFRGSFGLAHYWTRKDGVGIESACGMKAVETFAVGLLQANGADQCKLCAKRKGKGE